MFRNESVTDYYDREVHAVRAQRRARVAGRVVVDRAVRVSASR